MVIVSEGDVGGVACPVPCGVMGHAGRSSGREVAMEARADFVAPAPEAEPTVLPLLEQLPSSQKEVLLMLKVTGMSLEEVARATASTVGSVKQKAHRAYETLRRLMGEKS